MTFCPAYLTRYHWCTVEVVAWLRFSSAPFFCALCHPAFVRGVPATETRVRLYIYLIDRAEAKSPTKCSSPCLYILFSLSMRLLRVVRVCCVHVWLGFLRFL